MNTGFKLGLGILGGVGIMMLVSRSHADTASPANDAATVNANIGKQAQAYIAQNLPYTTLRGNLYNLQVQAARYREATGIQLPVENDIANYLNSIWQSGSVLPGIFKAAIPIILSVLV